MGCNCCCSTDKEKDKKPEEKPVDPKVEEAKELKEATVEAVEKQRPKIRFLLYLRESLLWTKIYSMEQKLSLSMR